MYGTKISGLFVKITVLLVVGCCCLSAEGKYGGGSGTPNDPYLIYSTSHMHEIGADPCDWDKNFKLLDDVTVYSGFIIAHDTDPSGSNGFNGVMDGNGHTVYGVYFYFPDYWNYYYGLFGCIGEKGIVKNLSVKNATLKSYSDHTGVFAPLAAVNYGVVENCYSSGTVIASGSCAGLVAKNYGLITNSSTDCSIQGLGVDSSFLGGLVAINYGNISDSDANASVSEGKYSLGGLVGYNMRGSIYDCGARGSVAGVGEGSFSPAIWIGGLAGLNYEGRIERSYADVSVFGENVAEEVGGLIGENVRSEIFSCYSIGPVSIDNSYSKNIGGLVGKASTSGITNCYSASHISAPNAVSDVGGFVGLSDNNQTMIYLSYWDIESSGIDYSNGGIGLATEQMQDINTYDGWGDDTWTIDNGIDYPKLVFQNQPGTQIIDPARSYGGGSGVEDDPYLIANAQQLSTISLYPGDWQKHFELINDVNLGEIPGDFIPIGYGSGFTGVFNGNGYSIENLNINAVQDYHKGLFALISCHGIVKNLNIDNFYIDIGLPEYGGIAGALAGTNKATVENCHSNGLIKAMSAVGGLIGVNRGEIFRSTFSGDLICRSNGGGLVGRNEWGPIWHSSSIIDIYNPNNALYVGGLVGCNQESSILYCKSNGSLTIGEGSEQVGGLVGLNNDSLISHCYSTVSVITEHNCTGVGGLVGKNSFKSVINSWSSGPVSTGDNSNNVGGLIGYNYSRVSNCYSESDVIGTTNVGGLVGYGTGSEYVEGGGLVEHSYCTGHVIGDSNVGGLIGTVRNSNVVSSFWDIETTGQTVGYNLDPDNPGTVANVLSMTTDKMRTQSTFIDYGWDFINVWGIGENQTYPYLRKYSAANINKDNKVDFLDIRILCEQWLEEQ